MDKLKMAHDWCMKHGDPENFKLTIAEAWEYADAMQAEADKRKADVVVMPASVDDFQIDWSQAHEAANWWVVDTDGNALWFVNKPSSDAGYWDVNDNSSVYLAPSFGYTGAWQDSLRKRPKENK